MDPVGRIAAISRFPVKSMRGESLSKVAMTFQGLPGDRLYAFVQLDRRGPFPWLTAREFPDMLQFEPWWAEQDAQPPVMVRTPQGNDLPVDDERLLRELEAQTGKRLRLHMDHRGNYDTAHVSVITTSTVRALCEAGGVEPDARRFRMNLLIESDLPPFSEERWLGRTLTVGDVTLAITEPDERCVMITMDPDSTKSSPDVLKAAAVMNEAAAGVYASVTAAGEVSLGDEVLLGW